MCGIVALAGYDKLNRVIIRQVLNDLTHRGPDDVGEWTAPSDYAWLGHRRLSIVDLSSSGHQPMSNEDKTVWMVGNGEIYNFPTLRSRLEFSGHRFYSNSDNEIILHAYETILWITSRECLPLYFGMRKSRNL